MRSSTRVLLGALLGSMLFASGALADTLTFNYNHGFSGPGTPSGTPVATLDDDGTPGTVRFVLDLTGLNSTGEKVGGWYFNTSTDITGSTVTGISKTGIFDTPSFNYSYNSTHPNYKADGDGFFDLVLAFNTSSAAAFGDNEKLEFTINFPGITVSTFDFGSMPPSGGGPGPFDSALHLQGTTTGSIWLAPGDGSNGGIPEPASVLLLGLGAVGVYLGRRRSRQ